MQPREPFRRHVDWIVESQHCRGPDFQAVETINGRAAGVVFGHNRLSIIDLSPAGNQPMWDVDRRVCLVFNGEIFNYIELPGRTCRPRTPLCEHVRYGGDP